MDKNAKGPLAPALHLMFAEHAADLREGMKSLTERIQTLDADHGSRKLETLHLSLKLGSYEFLETPEVIKELLLGHDAIVTAGEELLVMAVKFKDEATASVLVTRLKVHQKTAWWLRQMLEAS